MSVITPSWHMDLPVESKRKRSEPLTWAELPWKWWVGKLCWSARIPFCCLLCALATSRISQPESSSVSFHVAMKIGLDKIHKLSSEYLVPGKDWSWGCDCLFWISSHPPSSSLFFGTSWGDQRVNDLFLYWVIQRSQYAHVSLTNLVMEFWK